MGLFFAGLEAEWKQRRPFNLTISDGAKCANAPSKHSKHSECFYFIAQSFITTPLPFRYKKLSKCGCDVVSHLYNNSMKLMTQEIKKQLPDLYSQDGKGLNQVAVVKFFSPVGSWTWYASEFDGTDTFFGLVDGFEKELGYFSLSELESVTLPLGLKIERDLHFTPTPIKDLM